MVPVPTWLKSQRGEKGSARTQHQTQRRGAATRRAGREPREAAAAVLTAVHTPAPRARARHRRRATPPTGRGPRAGSGSACAARSQRSGRQAGARWRCRAAVTRSHAGRPDPTMRRVRARGSRALCFPGGVSVAGADSGSRPSRCAALAQATRLLPARPARRRAAGDARTVGRSRPEPLTARGRQAAWDLLGAHCDSVAQESGRDLHF